jgi:hypothetical protein
MASGTKTNVPWFINLERLGYQKRGIESLSIAFVFYDIDKKESETGREKKTI